MSVVLFLFWVTLSGMFDVFHLALGALSAIGVAVATRSLWRLEPDVSGLHARTWTGWISYLPWLMWQIIVSALQVVVVVLDPKMPIDPHVLRFKCRLPNPVAHLTLANSITLTPGTITLDLEEDEYTVHALTRTAGESLTPAQGEGEMQSRVAGLFRNWGES